MNIEEIIARAACRAEGIDPDDGDDENCPMWWAFLDVVNAQLSALKEAGFVVVHRQKVSLRAAMAGQEALRLTDCLSTSLNKDRWKNVPVMAFPKVYRAMIAAQEEDDENAG